jgi:hypothetical protein
VLHESPDNYEPSPEELDAADSLMREVGSGNQLSDAENLAIEQSKDSVHRESLAEQRRMFQEKIFQASDTLEATPRDFEQREVLRHILSAASRLSDAEGFMPIRRTSFVIDQLTEALALLRASVPEKVDHE